MTVAQAAHRLWQRQSVAKHSSLYSSGCFPLLPPLVVFLFTYQVLSSTPNNVHRSNSSSTPTSSCTYFRAGFIPDLSLCDSPHFVVLPSGVYDLHYEWCSTHIMPIYTGTCHVSSGWIYTCIYLVYVPGTTGVVYVCTTSRNGRRHLKIYYDV